MLAPQHLWQPSRAFVAAVFRPPAFDVVLDVAFDFDLAFAYVAAGSGSSNRAAVAAVSPPPLPFSDFPLHFLCAFHVKSLDLLQYSQQPLYTIRMPQRKKTTPEIEIKLRITDRSAILLRIRSLRAASQPRVREQNIVYDTPQSQLRRRGMLLRLRIETSASHNPRRSRRERVILTAKAPPYQLHAKKHPPRYKIRSERERAVHQSSRRYANALTALGFRPAFRYDKFRTTFLLPNLHLGLDETPAGAFLELEGSPRAIDRAARALGFPKRAYLRDTYWDLYAADCRRRRVIPKNMLFSTK
jgi:adenylate cyclase class 2